mmetsp:Transcript_39370/g.82802  ORF Transcript_39370/g.82802 Transcript_39370/m.82802 type:complete len:319 (+) Transcript_39370:893-1849(+)
MVSGMDLLLEAAGRSEGITSNASFNNRAQMHFSNSKRILSQNFATAKLNRLGASQVSRSSSMPALPPKKRLKLSFNAASGESMNSSFQLASSRLSVPSFMSSISRGSFSVESSARNQEWNTIQPTRNQEWTTIQPQLKVNRLLQMCNKSAVVPNKSARQNKKGEWRNSLKLNKSASDAGINRRVPSSSVSKVSSSSPNVVKDVNGNDMCMGYFSMVPRTISSEAEDTVSTITANSQDFSKSREEAVHSEPKNQSSTKPSNEEIRIPQSLMSAIPKSDEQVSQSQAPAPSSDLAKKLLYEAFLKALHQPQPKEERISNK